MYKQELERILEEIESLHVKILHDKFACKVTEQEIMALVDAKDIIRKHMNDGWIPVKERLPETDDYILLSFSNFSLAMVGRYEEDSDGGAFYLGDCDEEDTCISQDLFVNAWMPLPEPYREEREDCETE